MSERDRAEALQAVPAAPAAEHPEGAVPAELHRQVQGLAAHAAELTRRLLDTELTQEQRAQVIQLSRVADTLARLASLVPPAAAASPAAPRPRVLLVEDNAVNQRVAKLMLEKRGYEVEVANDGHEAVAATARAAYAAVLMDCQMPRFDGYSATLEIRRRDEGRARVPIIAMTANAGPGARERCLAAGMDDFIAKPVTAGALDLALRRWVEGAAAVSMEETPKPPVLAVSMGETPRPPAQPLSTGETPRPPALPRRRPSSPAVDLGMLRMLRSSQAPGAPDIVSEVIALFLRDAPERVAAVREAVARDDLPSAARAAHTLKGSAGHLGAKVLASVCARFEEKVRAGTPFDVPYAVEAIAEELERVRVALTREPRSSPGGGTPPPRG